jgi:hypothetical protein
VLFCEQEPEMNGFKPKSRLIGLRSVYGTWFRCSRMEFDRSRRDSAA